MKLFDTYRRAYDGAPIPAVVAREPCSPTGIFCGVEKQSFQMTTPPFNGFP
jgi:hypothetical protein